jgi:crotonobetainyl-CoA:carnitine CoA-transferase CaiB-like acyl-CoA transferase
VGLPLEGIRVLELGHAVAGPFAGVMLADFGADVVKVERPGVGDTLRVMGPQVGGKSLWFSVTGRNKRSICIDLHAREGRVFALPLLLPCMKAEVVTRPL